MDQRTRIPLLSLGVFGRIGLQRLVSDIGIRNLSGLHSGQV